MTFEIIALILVALLIGAFFGPCGFILVACIVFCALLVWLIVANFLIVFMLIFSAMLLLFIFAFSGRNY